MKIWGFDSRHVLGSTTIYEPIIASMWNSSRESGDQYIFFITWGITFLFDSIYGRFIILCSMSMMSSLVSIFLILSFRTIFCKVSYFITSITSTSREIFSRVSFRKNAYLWSDENFFWFSWNVLWELDLHFPSSLLWLLS